MKKYFGKSSLAFVIVVAVLLLQEGIASCILPADNQKPDPKQYGAFWYYDEEVIYTDIIGEDALEPGNQIVRWTGSDSVLEIPSEINEVPMKLLGSEAIIGQKNLTTIVFPDSTMELERGAIKDCPNLTKVVLHDALQIKDNPFVDCPNLKEFILDEGSTRYGMINGNLCNLDSMVLITPNQIEMDTCEIPDTIQRIGDMAYYNREDIQILILPEDLTEIGYRAFDGCANLQEITWSESLTEIGQLAFHQCDTLAIVRLPESLESIGPFAFEDCDSLKAVFIPKSLTSMGIGAFENCPEVCVYVHEGSYAEEWMRSPYNVNYVPFRTY